MYWPYLILLAILLGLLLFSQRARRRQAADELQRSARIAVGTEVMTTSGLYGTVVSRNDDDTVMLAIAPGVEVRWAVAALRDATALPERYRQAIRDSDGAPDGRDSTSDSTP